MAKSVTNSFWLTETLDLTVDTTVVQDTIDLGAYVDVGDRQAVSIEAVDYIFQRENATGVFSTELAQVFTADATIDLQLSDLNPETLIQRADARTLISSGGLTIAEHLVETAAGVFTNELFGQWNATDLYPDNYGVLDEARTVVNDQLYFTGVANGPFAANETCVVTVRIKCRIIKLGMKDWMAIAIQSTAADN